MLLDVVEIIVESMHPAHLLETGGMTWLLLIVFLETGIFLGVFLPGDSLLFTAGLLCGSVYLDVSIYELILGLTAAGFLGSVAGYGFGRKAGKMLLGRKDSLFFKQQYLSIAETYCHRYGNLAFLFGRFVPVARTFVPIVAGLGRSPWWSFVGYNLVGAGLWATLLAGTGYWLGHQFPGITHYLEWIIIGIVLLTAIPLVLSWVRQRSPSAPPRASFPTPERPASSNPPVHVSEH